MENLPGPQENMASVMPSTSPRFHEAIMSVHAPTLRDASFESEALSRHYEGLYEKISSVFFEVRRVWKSEASENARRRILDRLIEVTILDYVFGILESLLTTVAAGVEFAQQAIREDRPDAEAIKEISQAKHGIHHNSTSYSEGFDAYMAEIEKLLAMKPMEALKHVWKSLSADDQSGTSSEVHVNGDPNRAVRHDMLNPFLSEQSFAKEILKDGTMDYPHDQYSWYSKPSREIKPQMNDQGFSDWSVGKLNINQNNAHVKDALAEFHRLGGSQPVTTNLETGTQFNGAELAPEEAKGIYGEGDLGNDPFISGIEISQTDGYVTVTPNEQDPHNPHIDINANIHADGTDTNPGPNWIQLSDDYESIGGDAVISKRLQ